MVCRVSHLSAPLTVIARNCCSANYWVESYQPIMMNVPSQNWSWWLKFGACVTGCISGVMARDVDSRGEWRS